MLRFVALTAAIVVAFYWASSRRRDPTDFASADETFAPVISIARFLPYRDVDPLDFDDAIAAVREFSRLYQTTFLHGCDVIKTVRLMHSARQTFARNMHRVRFWLPNSSADEAQILAGIEETRGAMAVALAEVTRRFPDVRLLYGSGAEMESAVRSVDDVWHS